MWNVRRVTFGFYREAGCCGRELVDSAGRETHLAYQTGLGEGATTPLKCFDRLYSMRGPVCSARCHWRSGFRLPTHCAGSGSWPRRCCRRCRGSSTGCMPRWAGRRSRRSGVGAFGQWNILPQPLPGGFTIDVGYGRLTRPAQRTRGDWPQFSSRMKRRGGERTGPVVRTESAWQ